MSTTLYHTDISPPSRVIRILIKHLGLNFNEKHVDLMAGEHLKPEFTSINPFHVVPTLVDGDFVLWESRAILTYIVEKYAPESPVYSKDLKVRATINRWLFWDAGTLYAALADYYGPAFRGAPLNAEASELFKLKVKDLDKSLESSNYVAGTLMTIADFTICVTVTMASAVGIDSSGLKNVTQWLKRMEKALGPVTWSSLVVEPANALGGFIKSKTSS